MRKGAKTAKEKNAKSTSEEVESTENGEVKGFEPLLKPTQDNIVKDWKYRLAVFLDAYTMHLAKLGYINFTEAAMIIQNSSSYYSRRVDIMHSWIIEFCSSLCIDGEGENVGKAKTKKSHARKKKGPLEDDELDRFDYSSTATCHRVHFEKNVISDLEFTLLNVGARAPSKPGAACPVFQLNKEDMGYKDEFRMCWKLLGNGRLHKEILDWENRDYDEFELEDIPQEYLVVPENDNTGNDNSVRSMNPSPLPPEDEPPRLSNLPMDDNAPDHFSYEENAQLPEKKPILVRNVDPYSKVFPLAHFIIHKRFKKCHVFTVEKEDTEGKKEMPQKKKKIKKYIGPKGSCHLSFSELVGGKAEDLISYRLRKRQTERLKLLHSLRKLFKKTRHVPELDIDPIDEDENHEDFNDTLGFLRDGEHRATSMSCFNASQRSVIEDAYKESIKVDHLKKRDDALTVQRRVADWHEMIQPALVEAEKRSEFDVHSYGTKILEEFNEVGEIKPLKEVIKTSEYKEVCRYVLSTLMLSNTYNVEIVKSDPRELAKDNINLKFLTSTRHHEELDANIGEAAASTH